MLQQVEICPIPSGYMPTLLGGVIGLCSTVGDYMRISVIQAAAIENCLAYLCDEVDRDEMWHYANDTMRDAAQVSTLLS